MTASSDKINYDECFLHDQNWGAFKQNRIIEQLFLVQELNENMDTHFKYLKVNLF